MASPTCRIRAAGANRTENRASSCRISCSLYGACGGTEHFSECHSIRRIEEKYPGGEDDASASPREFALFRAKLLRNRSRRCITSSQPQRCSPNTRRAPDFLSLDSTLGGHRHNSAILETIAARPPLPHLRRRHDHLPVKAGLPRPIAATLVLPGGRSDFLLLLTSNRRASWTTSISQLPTSSLTPPSTWHPPTRHPP